MFLKLHQMRIAIHRLPAQEIALTTVNKNFVMKLR